MAQTIEAVMD